MPNPERIAPDGLSLGGKLSNGFVPRAEADPADMITKLLSLTGASTAAMRFCDYRLSQLVLHRLDLEEAEAQAFVLPSGGGGITHAIASATNFDACLRTIIAQHGLGSLFGDDGPGRYHHAIRPRGYDYRIDAVDPLGMEQWRADYRALETHQQMLAASIVWLYRAGKDNRWLRRVPCTWPAIEGLDHMRRHGVLADWGHLVAAYPGW